MSDALSFQIQHTKKPTKIVLTIKSLRHDTHREIEIFNKDIIHIEGAFYLQIYDIKNTMNNIDGEEYKSIEVYIILYEERPDKTWNIIFKGWIGNWPYGRIFQHDEIFKAIDVVLGIKEVEIG